MSIRRMMLFTLGGFFKSVIALFKTRVISDGGNFEAETNLENQLNTLGSDLFDSASLIITPNAYKEQTLYSIKPTEGYTNLILQSENFTVSPWTLLATPNVTRTANAGTAPDGTNTPTLITSNTDTTSRGIRQLITLFPTQKQYIFSCWVKSNDGAVITIDIGDSGTKTFNLTPTWERVSVLSTPSSLGFVDIAFSPNQLGKTFYIWGGQLEEGTTPGNYIKTTTRPILKGSIGDLDVVRATTATRVNEQGLIEPVPYNLFSYSEDFGNSNWSKQNTTISNNSIAAPNGTMTADKIIGNSGVTYSYTGNLGVNVSSISFVINSTERVVSFYLKYGGLNRIRVIYGSSTNLNGGAYVEVDLQLGIITGTYGGSFASNFFIEYAGNGWYRVGFTVLMTLSSTNNRFGIGLGDTTKTVGDGVDGVYVWGAQLVDDSSNKPYQLTTNRLNIPRIDYSTGKPAILVEPQRTNLVFPSNIATTQTRTVTAQAYTLSFYGTGSVTLSGVATGTLVGTGANNRVTLTFTPTAGSLTLTVSGSVTNWQLEVGSDATSLIPTTTSAVTRNADVIRKTGASTLIGQTEGTVLIKGTQTARGVIFRLINSTSTKNSISIFSTGFSGRCEYAVIKNGVSVLTSSPTTPNLQVNKNIIIKYSQTTIKVFINGVLFWTYNYPTSTDFTEILDKIEFGSLTEQGLARFDLIAIWKTQLTDQQAIKLTTL